MIGIDEVFEARMASSSSTIAVERGEHGHLGGLLLDHRLEDDLSVVEVAQVGREANALEGKLAVLGVELSPPDGPFERGVDTGPAPLQRRVVDLAHDYVEAPSHRPRLCPNPSNRNRPRRRAPAF